MSVWKAISILIRWPNLLFIALTQGLSWLCLVHPALGYENPFSPKQLYLLFCTVLIAAAGYMINDYFDWQIDTINKPERVVIGKRVQRRSIILLHFFFNALALCFAYSAIETNTSRWVLAWPAVSILLLWFYSTTFKRKLVIGNLVVACMTALTVAMPAIFTWTHFQKAEASSRFHLGLYVAFAFLITFIREIIKDIEDIKGDASQACQTIPLVWGINVARYLVDGFWLLLMGLLVSIRLFPFETSPHAWVYPMLLIPIPWLMYSMHRAKTSRDYHQVSTWVKVYTLLGILSMVF